MESILKEEARKEAEGAKGGRKDIERLKRRLEEVEGERERYKKVAEGLAKKVKKK